MRKVVGLAFALALASSAPAVAAPTTCTGYVQDMTIAANLDVPAGATCTLVGSVVNGNVTVEGTMLSYGTRFDKNVTVTGGVITIANGNGLTSALAGNLTITGSTAMNYIGCPNKSNIIQGNLTFTGNSGRLYVCEATVQGSVTVNDNLRVNIDWQGATAADLNRMTVGKNLTCSGNLQSGGPVPVSGGNNTATNKLGQCAGL